MPVQLDIFTAPPPTLAEYKAQQEAKQRESWKSCWDWGGPVVGGYCTIQTCRTTLEAGGVTGAYTELCRLLEERPDGSWLAVIEMGEFEWCGGKRGPWHKDGTRVILGITDIWAPHPSGAYQRLLAQQPGQYPPGHTALESES
jgi:hypothetical protein